MPILRAEEETKVREWFGALARPVELFVALGPEETPRAGTGDLDFGAEMVQAVRGTRGARRRGDLPDRG